jgi:serine/threonine-protein kinase
MSERTDRPGGARPGTAPAGATDDPVRALVARGAYVEAAAAAAERGETRRAVALLEKVWRFADALPLALAIPDWPLAVRLALDAGDPARATAIAEEIPDADRPALAAAAEILAKRGHLVDAAVLFERAGALDRATALLEQAGALLEAARVHEAAGRVRDAGRLYEQQIRIGARAGEPPDDRTAAAYLGLGRLLGALGKHRDAAAALQRAAHHPGAAAPAWRRLCRELLGLGLPHAAEACAARARHLDPALPETAEEIAALVLANEATSAGDEAPSRFSDLRLLGASAVGRVYAATDRLLGRTVVLKILSVGTASEAEREALRRFLREAEATRRLRHPHIVALLEVEESAGLLVLEHLPGGTLAERLAAEGPVAPAVARRLALDLLSGLEAAHGAGIVHRDVKPDNVFFDVAGNAKLADFGAAHLLDFGQTQTGGFIGTLAYLSPEQVSGGAIDFAADLYGLGVTLFQALTGRLPFEGPDFVAQHLAEPPPPPTSIAPHLADVHDDVLLRALAKAPQARFPSAAAMASAVRGWPEGEPAAAPAPKRAPPAREASPAPAAPEREVGRTAAGRLLLVEDPRVGRAVLVEARDRPLDAHDVDALGALARAGGPRVQRLLALDVAQGRVVFEHLEGEIVPLAALGAAERAAVAEGEAALAAAGAPPGPEAAVVRTPGGPVLLVVSPPAVPTGGPDQSPSA